ncbi:MAG: NIPSNAP family protein [Isosphaeraceae bacterium]
MMRFVMTGMLVATSMISANAGEKSSTAPAPAKEKEPACECSSADDSAARVFELRTYYVNDGKLVDLHKRFRDHTCQLLKKHGAELIGFWTPTDEKDGKGGKLIYLVAFPSREAAKKTWEDFGKDPEWRKVYTESHKNGVLVKKVDSVFMEPTDYSALK